MNKPPPPSFYEYSFLKWAELVQKPAKAEKYIETDI